MQLRIVGNYIVPARAGVSCGCEIKATDRYAAIVAAGERPAVAAAMVAGLVYRRLASRGPAR